MGDVLGLVQKDQGSLKETHFACPFETCCFFNTKIKSETTIYESMFRCVMQGSLYIGLWLKLKQEGLHRFWSMFPLTRVPFWVPVF